MTVRRLLASFRPRCAGLTIRAGGCTLLLILLMAVMPAKAQQKQDTESRQEQPAEGDQATSSDTDSAEFYRKFWQYMQKQKYQERWARMPAGTGGFTEGKSPHGVFLKVYANETAANSPRELPAKSVLIKENYDKDKKLIAITPMYNVGNNYHPEHGNWFWAKYKPDGSIFESEGKKLSGRVQGCIDCHESAGGDDYVFTNDK